MADYFTQASFIIPCASDQAETAIEALQHIDDQFDEYAGVAISKSDEDLLRAEEKILRHCFINHPEQNDNSPNYDLCWSFNVKTCEGGLWVYADENINTEEAAIFTQAVLVAFDLPSLVEIQASHTCSKSRVNAFVGHACVVSKDFIRWDNSYSFLDSERKAHTSSERYFVCDITEVNGEFEYSSHFLMKCSGEDDPEQRLDEIFVNYRGDGDKESDSFVWYDSGTAAKNPQMAEITPYEFNVMKAHLSAL